MGRTIIVPMLMVDLNDLMTDVVKIVKFARQAKEVFIHFVIDI